MNDYTKPASQKKEEEKPQLEKVITGGAKARKPNALRTAGSQFFTEDASNVFSYILTEVLVPAAKKALSDVVTNGLDMFLYGETGHSSRPTGARVAYNSYGKNDRDASRTRRGSRFDFDDIILDTRSDGEKVLNAMMDVLSEYGVVSVADLYDLVDLPSEFTDNRYGWSSLKGAEVVRVKNGYMLKMPRVMAID